jgi:hypothetical protein
MADGPPQYAVCSKMPELLTFDRFPGLFALTPGLGQL